MSQNPNDPLIAFIYHNEKLPVLINGDIEIILAEDRVNFIFLSNREVYQLIEMDEVFNYEREMYQRIKGGHFKPNFNYEIEMTLKPEFIPQLLTNASTSIQAIEYLSRLSVTQPNADLLKGENWFILSVKQYQKGKTVELKTLWTERIFE
jgi:hypothetical protein